MYSSLSKKKARFHSADLRDGRMEQRYRRQLTARVGIGATPSVDPVYRLIGDFSKQFDAVGRQRAAQLGQTEAQREIPPQNGDETAQSKETAAPESSREKLTADELRRRHDSPVYSHSAKELADGDFYSRFSSHAFRCGTLAASVMAGKGKEMFTTCCRRAGAYAPAGSQHEKKILSAKSTSAKVRNQPATLVFDGEVKAAVGIVVDSIRSASRIFEVFKQTARDDTSHSDNKLQQYGVETMKDLYPFLRQDEDTRLIAEYRGRLKALENDSSPEGLRQKKTLDSALRKAVAVKERKIVEQKRFKALLSRITANVAEAERMFSADGFAEELAAELREMPDLPDGDGDNRNRRTLEGSILEDILDSLFGAEDDIPTAESEAEHGEAPTSPAGEAPTGT